MTTQFQTSERVSVSLVEILVVIKVKRFDSEKVMLSKEFVKYILDAHDDMF